MQFAHVENAFGTDAFAPAGPAPVSTTYYRSMRLQSKPGARRAPKLLPAVKNFLLTYNG